MTVVKAFLIKDSGNSSTQNEALANVIKMLPDESLEKELQGFTVAPSGHQNEPLEGWALLSIYVNFHPG